MFRALSGEALIRVDLNGANAPKADQWPMGARIREVEQGPDGEVYLLEDGEGGGAAAAAGVRSPAVAELVRGAAFAPRLGGIARLGPAAGIGQPIRRAPRPAIRTGGGGAA